MSDRHPLIYNEFDIEAARKAGKSFEQERIIKLLTDNYDYISLNQLIALIKGEK